MNIYLTSKEPVTLNTANKYCKEDINVHIEVENTYTPVEYISFSGLQLLNTGFPLWSYSNWKVEVEFMPTKFYDYSHIFSVSDGDSYHESWIASKGGYHIRLERNVKADIATLTLSEKVKIAHEFIDGSCLTYINDELVNTTTFASFSITDNLRFGKRDTSYFIGNLYGLKLYADGELVRDFIPVKYVNSGSTYVQGMYDLVERKLHTNGDDFIAGPEIKEE